MRREVSWLPTHHPLLHKLRLLRIELLLMLSHLLELLDVLVHRICLRLVLVAKHLHIRLLLLLLLLDWMIDVALGTHSILDRVVGQMLIQWISRLLAILWLPVVTRHVSWRRILLFAGTPSLCTRANALCYDLLDNFLNVGWARIFLNFLLELLCYPWIRLHDNLKLAGLENLLDWIVRLVRLGRGWSVDRVLL